MAAARKLLGRLVYEVAKDFLAAAASAAGSNLGNRVAPPKHPSPPSGDDKEK